MARFAIVSEDMLFDEDFLTLPPNYQHVWLVLCATPMGGRCGIFKGGLTTLARQTGRPAKLIKAAMDAFEQRGWILRQGEYTWIRNRIRYQGWNTNWRRSALAEAKALLDKTPLAAKCLEYYAQPHSNEGDNSKPHVSSAQVDRKSGPTSKQVDGKLPPSSGVVWCGKSSLNSEDLLLDNIPAKSAKADSGGRDKPKRTKPKPPPLAEVEQRLPEQCADAWQRFTSMVASQNKTEAVSDSRLAGLLVDILGRCGELPPQALAHGLIQACQAGDGKGAPNAIYVAKCAAGWRGIAGPMQYAPEPEMLTGEEVIARQLAALRGEPPEPDDDDIPDLEVAD